MRKVLSLYLIATLLGVQSAVAAPSTLTYQGRIVRPDGTPLEYSSVSFIFKITNPSGSCVLYQEQVSGYDMTNSGGVFDIPIGQGSRTFPAAGVFSVADAFANTAVLSCQGGASYSPLVSDGRLLRVQFHDGIGWRTVSPDSVIRSVPYASYSQSSEKLGDKTAGDFVLKNVLPTCTVGTFLTWSGSAFTCGTPAGGGTVSTVSSTNSYLSILSPTSTPTLTINVGTVANTVAAGDDNRLVNALQNGSSASGDLSGNLPNPTVAKIQGVGVSAIAPTLNYVLKYNGSSWAPAPDALGGPGTVTNVTGTAPISVATGTSTPVVSMTQSNTTTDGYLSATDWNNFNGKLGTASSFSGDVTGISTAMVVEKIRGVNVVATAPTTGQVLTYNGASWAPAATGASGVTSITADTGLTGGTITTTGTIGLGMELAGLNGLSSTGFIKRTAAGAYSTPAISLAADVSGALPIANGGTGQTNKAAAFDALSPLATKGDIQVFNGTSNVSLSIGADGKFLKADSAQAAGLVWADAVATDLSSMVATGIVQRNGSNSYSAVTVNSPLTYSAGALGVNSGAGGILRDGGNTTGATVSVGTNDNNDLALKTDGTTKFTVLSGGNVGVGTTLPSEKLEVVGNIKGTQLCIGSDCRSAWPGAGGGGTVTSVGSGTGLTGGPITGTGTLNVDVGTTTGKIVQVAASNKLPAIDGSDLTNLNASNLSAGTLPTGRLPALTGDATSTAGSNSITLNTVPISKGGTGQTAANAALNALLPSQGSNSGKVLQTDGTNATWVSPSGGTITALTGDVTASGSGSVAATIANDAVNSAKIADGTVGVADLNFAGSMATNTGIVVRDGTQLYNKTCTANQVLIWTVANGWSCSAAVLSESDPKVGSNTTNYLSKWDGSALVASGVYESGGNVGIGTTNPGAATKLSVTGQIHSSSSTTVSGVINWINGNAVSTTFDCASNVSFVNLRDGGSYTLVVTGAGTTKCTFDTAATGDDGATVSYRFMPTNAVRTASSHTIYSMQRIGNIVYVSWITGF